MDNELIYDQHTLYISSGKVPHETLIKYIQDAISDLNKKISKPIDVRYEVNVVTNSKNEPTGLIYLWMHDIRAYFALCGRNLDGSRRVVLRPDPKWTPPRVPIEVAMKSLPDLKTARWSDYQIAEDNLIASYQRPMVEEILPPLIDLNLLSHRLRLQLHNLDIKVAAAFAEDLEPDRCVATLRATKVPDGINAEQIRRVFSPFSSSPEYPVVRFEGRTVLVRFDPTTHDARFAIIMRRKVVLKHNKREHVLRFTHAINTY